MSGEEAQRRVEAYSADPQKRWLAWGPYLSERQWGTVREDYSADGDAWNYFPHDHARSRAYRWGEDGLAGLSDEEQRLCFALTLWNGRDAILKERLFGLTNGQGNHGEDVKEYYFFLDNTPTHSFMRWLYKYPQRAYPYADLVAENARRKRDDPKALEYELMDSGVFADNRYFNVEVTYAKAGPSDICVRIAVTNLGPEEACLDVLPTLWFRNTWSWDPAARRPQLTGTMGPLATVQAMEGDAAQSGMMLYCDQPDALLFADNETNAERLWGSPDSPRYPKDGINDHVVLGRDTVNPALRGTKAAARWTLQVPAGATRTLQLRLTSALALSEPFDAAFDATFARRSREADAFWEGVAPPGLSADRRRVLRQAYAGMLWSKQFYYYVVRDWLKGDPGQIAPPEGRTRNAGWKHFYSSNILTMPDTWEYPWFAAWDLCFQAVVFARVDAQFAKNQLLTLAHEWFMSPAGAVPAYEWAFGDVNPPLHAWAALRIVDAEAEMTGEKPDLGFLEAVFRYGLIYFTWWANRKDEQDDDIFGGGFLGLDNISIVDRSHLDALEAQVRAKVQLAQSDGTSWMGMFCLNMMEIALRLAKEGNAEYDRLADRFFQHFVFMSEAVNGNKRGVQIWDETDGFYYDALRVGEGGAARHYSVKLRSLVGVIALFPCLVVNLGELLEPCARRLRERGEWFQQRHPELMKDAVSEDETGEQKLLAFAAPERLRAVLKHVLAEAEMLSPHGVRGLSKEYQTRPYRLNVGGAVLTEQYEPAESVAGLYGGNSNWRGPLWFPINFLLIEALRRYHAFLGDDFSVEFPTGSGRLRTLKEVASELSRRLASIFLRGPDGKRPVYGGNQTFQTDPEWRDLVLFYEYFHGDNGAGIGASHQTGWTGLVVELLRES